MISTSPDASDLVAKAEAVGSEPMDNLSAMLGATVEEGPKVAITEDVTVVVTLAAASQVAQLMVPPTNPPSMPPAPPTLSPPPPTPPPVAAPKHGVLDEESGILDEESGISLGWKASMAIGGGAFLCLCVSTLWVSNLLVARRRRRESGGTAHSNIFGCATANRWGSSKSDHDLALGRALGRPDAGAGAGARMCSGLTMATAEIDLRVEGNPEQSLLDDRHKSTGERGEGVPMGTILSSPGDGKEGNTGTGGERSPGRLTIRRCHEGEGFLTGEGLPSPSDARSALERADGQAGARSALERARQARVRSRSMLTAPSKDTPPLVGVPPPQPPGAANMGSWVALHALEGAVVQPRTQGGAGLWDASFRSVKPRPKLWPLRAYT